MGIRATPRANETVAVYRGQLLYSLSIAAHTTSTPPHNYYNALTYYNALNKQHTTHTLNKQHTHSTNNAHTQQTTHTLNKQRTHSLSTNNTHQYSTCTYKKRGETQALKSATSGRKGKKITGKKKKRNEREIERIL